MKSVVVLGLALVAFSSEARVVVDCIELEARETKAALRIHQLANSYYQAEYLDGGERIPRTYPASIVSGEELATYARGTIRFGTYDLNLQGTVGAISHLVPKGNREGNGREMSCTSFFGENPTDY